MLRTAVLWAAVLTSWPAAGQGVACGTHEQILATLAEDFEEHPVGRGLLQDGKMIEVLASEAGSFSVLVTIPGGLSCLVGAGSYWLTLAGTNSPDKMLWRLEK